MDLQHFIEKVTQGVPVSFNETIIVITENYYYLPTEFSNGLGEDILVNKPGNNEGSCKIFAFAKLHHLTQEQALSLFGDYYRLDVLTKPEGDDHQNIRKFIKYGWDGIHFLENPLTPKIVL